MADAIDPVSLTPGMAVGAYTIEKLVGHGGFGYLYRVVRDGKAYALKISRFRPADMDEDIRQNWEARLDREVAALKTLNHPNIVRVHTFDSYPTLDDGYPYLVMELVDGVQLDKWRKKAKPTLRQVASLMATVAEAVGHIHEHGIFHRDLKPANILVRASDGAPVIVDFGIARSENGIAVTGAGWSIGTIAYFAPEYADFLMTPEGAGGGTFQWNAATDLHSLGYIFYELLTGRPPFPLPAQDGGDTAVYATIKSYMPIAPSVRTEGLVPEAIDDVVMKLLAKDPADRFPSGAALGAALRPLLADAGPEWDEKLPTVKATPKAKALAAAAPRTAAGPASVAAEVAVAEAAAVAAAMLATPTPAPRFVAIPGAASSVKALDAAARQVAAEEAPAPAFSPPTVAKPRLTEIGRAPGKAAAAESPDALPPIMGTEVRKRLGQLDDKRTGVPLAAKLVAGATLLLVVLFGGLIIAARSAPQPQRKIDLIKAVEDEKARAQAQQAAAETQAVPPPAPDVRPMTLGEDVAPPPARPDPALAAAPLPAPAQPVVPPAAAPRTRDEEVRALEERQFGGAHRTRAEAPRRAGGAAPDAPRTAPAAPRAAPADDGGWLKRSTRVASSRGPAKSDKVGVPFGSHLKVKLLSNLDSRTISNAPVEAVLPSALMVGDAMVLPPRTVLYGMASASGGRFTITFSRMRLPDNSEVAFTAVALDLGDGKAGLRASRAIAPERREGPGLGSRIAKNAASGVVSSVPLPGAGIAGSIARGAAGEAVAGAGESRDVGGGGESAILLDAPVMFDVFVTAAF